MHSIRTGDITLSLTDMLLRIQEDICRFDHGNIVQLEEQHIFCDERYQSQDDDQRDWEYYHTDSREQNQNGDRDSHLIFDRITVTWIIIGSIHV